MLETTSSTVRLELLGGAWLHAPQRKAWKLERKTAALLAFLTLEGGTTRSRLAGLLWPDSLESTARNNLSQVARRLREGAGIALLTGDDRLNLSPELSIDASILELESFSGNDETVLGFAGELLEGLDYDDCPEFQDWLLIKREGFLALRRDAHLRLSQAAEQAGQPRLALEHASQVLELDPVSEVAHRHVMRLHYQNGDRGAALNAFERCKQTLEQELAVPPLPETLALAEAISQGATVQQAVPTRLEIPLTVLRPPILIGREHEWGQLEAAWNQGIQIVICGEPGIGKSRLLFDFTASHGQHLLLEGRPGDANVSFSSYARSLRRTLSTFPALELEDWVQSELSRLLPELTNTAPAPLQNQEEKLRFFEAVACALETICQQQVLSSIVVDDLQFMDAASLEAHEYIVTRLTPTGVRFLNAHRSNELPATLEERIQTQIGTGTTARIEIKALEVEQVAQWITSLEINAPDLNTPDLSARLVKHTGGNPMFMLETIKSLLETNQLSQNAALPTPTRVGTLIRQRLERLSGNALRLARIAAITSSDYSLGLAAKILETNALDLSEIADELEQTQLMTGNHFAHDLIFEAVRAGTPKSIATFVHTQTALHLETGQAEPVRIAVHWHEAAQPLRAAPFWERAGQIALEQYRLQEACEFFERAARAWLLEHPDRALKLLHSTVLHRASFDLFDHTQALIELMFETARSPSQQVLAWLAKVTILNIRLLPIEAEVAIRAGLALNVPEHSATLRAALAETLWRQKRHDEAIPQMLAAIQEYAALGDAATQAQLEGRLGIYYGDSENHSAAREHLERSVNMLEQLGDEFATIKSRNMLGLTLGRVGRAQEAMLQHELVRAGCERIQGADHLAQMNQANMGQRYFELDRYAQALETVEHCLTGLHPKLGWPRAFLLIHRLRIKLRLAALDNLETLETQILSIPEINDELRFDLALLTVQRLQRLGLLEAAREHCDHVRNLSGTLTRPFNQIDFKLTEANLAPPKQALELSSEALWLATRHDLNGLRIAALTRLAQVFLRQGNLQLALEHSQQATNDLQHLDCNSFYRIEVYATHLQILGRCQPQQVLEVLQQARNQLLQIANHHVPAEYRQGFLERNPHNAAILELARKSGLKIS